MTTAKTGIPEIRIPVPPRIHAELAKIAGFGTVEAWAQRVLADAAEEARPALRTSGMWSMDRSKWWDLINDVGED
jgi:hypothetical protein